MGIFNALFAGVNGINSNGNAISTLGDNIANVNTIGFKASRASFEDILAGSEANIGLGSRISSVSPQFSQGGFESSSSVTDLAIDGQGFFVVKNTDGSTFYSRSGQFIIDKDGYLINASNQRLQGFTVDVNHSITSNIDDIQISTAPVPPQPSDSITMSMNLDSNDTSPAAFSLTDPNGTSNFSSGVTVYDSLGNSHLVSLFFRKSAANSWEWFALVDGGEITGGTAGVYEQEANGTITFDTQGALVSATTTASDFDFVGAAQTQAINFDFGTGTGAGGTGLDGVTQFGSNSALSNITQDGYASGSLKSIDISQNGIITGNYTNGTTQNIAQVVLASFHNEEALVRVGNNNYRETLDSGSAIISAPAGAGKGSLVSHTLEQSNVDLANELIRMVIIQRGFQANSRTITTINDMLAQLVNLGQ